LINKERKVIKTFALLNILLTFALMMLGSYTQSSAAGLECLNWPICYQVTTASSMSLFGIGYALLHRAIAGLVILLNTYLFFKDKSNKAYRIGLFLLIIQSILGGLNVFYKFPTIMSVGHLYISIAYIVIFARSLFHFDSTRKLDTSTGAVKDLISLSILFVIIQFFLGGLINHTSSALNCSNGTIVSFACFEAGDYYWWPLKVSSKIHMLHRFNSVLILVSVVSIFLVCALKKLRELYLPAIFGLWMIGNQMIGAGKMLSDLSLGNSSLSESLHLLLATCLLIVLFYQRGLVCYLEKMSFGKEKETFLSDLFELTKPRLGLLVVATIFSGVLLSGEVVDFFYLSWAIFLSTLIVASATTLNCYMEVEVDAKMERTKNRALPSGRLSKNAALIQGIILIALAFPLTGFTVNWSTALLGLIAFALYLFAYTPMKQFSPFALYVGAIPGAIPPVMGRTIVVGYIDPLAWILFAVLFVWQLPHFMAISIYHNDDYLSGGIKVYSHFWNEKLLKIAIFLLTIILVLISLLPTYLGLMPFAYCIAATILGLVFIALSSIGFFTKTKESYVAWARRYFWGSIIYLPLLMAAMIFLS